MQPKEKKERRSVRYTFVLTPVEFETAKKAAQSQDRTLPDFLRAYIHKAAPSASVEQSQNAASSE